MSNITKIAEAIHKGSFKKIYYKGRKVRVLAASIDAHLEGKVTTITKIQGSSVWVKGGHAAWSGEDEMQFYLEPL